LRQGAHTGRLCSAEILELFTIWYTIYRKVKGKTRRIFDLAPNARGVILSKTADRAYQEIRSQIRGGLLPPGSRLVERSLCREMGMSRTPVREALRRLAAEGLVESRPHRGMMIPQLSDEELDEVFEVGLVLESYMAALATRKSGGKPLNILRRLLNDMREALSGSPPDRLRYVELDQAFHAAIAGLAGNQRLANMLETAMDVRALQQAFCGSMRPCSWPLKAVMTTGRLQPCARIS
jgi:DNA-binding GntR family transcriptional regulator